MQWPLEDLLGATEDMGFLWDPLTYALACSHCGHCCLHSPGYLVILFLFVVWQIQRWQQRESWCSEDTMQGKDLPLQYDLAFFDHLWQKKSEEKEGKEREEEEDQTTSLEPVKSCSPPKEAPTGDQDTTAPLQPSCDSESLPKATGTREQISTQPSCPFRSFPTFQITTNLPVRNKNASRSCLQQRKGQLFFGLPSQHSESLETIFLSLDSSSPLKLSVCPSVFFNKLPFLPRYNLLLPHYCSPTQLPIHEAHTREDLEGMAPDDAQLVPPPSSSPVPSLSLHLKPLPMDNYGGEAHKQWLKQERDILQVSDDQTLYPQPSVQGITTSNCLSSSEACGGEPWDPRLQHNPESPSTSPLYSSSSLGVLTRFEALLRAVKQNKHPKGCEPAMPAPSPSLASLPELQRVSPMGGLSGSKTLWETTEQKKDPQTSEPPILAACQSTVPMTEFQRSSPPCSLPRYEAQWGTTGHKESPQVPEPSNSDSCQSLVSLPEPPKVSPKHSAPKNFQGNMGYRQNPQVKSPMPAHFSPLDSHSKLQEKNPPKYSFGYEPQWGYTANLGNPRAIELLSLDCNPELCETRPVCVPSGSETPWNSMQMRALWVSADSVSPPSLLSLPSAFLLQSLEMGSQGLRSESKALWDTKGQKMYFWVCDSSEPAQITPLASPAEPHRITSVGGLSRLGTTWKVTEHSKNSWASEPPFLALSPSPTLVCKPVKVIPMRALSDEAMCEDIQRKKNWASELPTPSLLQDLHGASLLALSDSEPLMGNTEHKENYCIPMPPIWGPSSLANSVSKSHINESSGDQSKCKPEGKAVELRHNCWATELPASSSLSAPLPEPHANLKFVYKDVQQKEVPWGTSPAVGDPLHLIPWPPILAEAPKIEPTQCGPHKGEVPEAKADVPSSQGQAVPEVLTHSRVPAWQWSRELENRLKKLQQNPAFTSPGPSQSFCSSAALSSTRLDSWKLSSWAPKKTHPPNLHLHSCCHPPNVQSTAPQPVQDSHYLHSSQELQPLASRQAEQGSQEEERIKGKMVAQIPSHGPGFHKKAGANSLGLGKPSNTGVLASGKRQNKALALSLDKKRENPRKLKTVECGRGNTRLGSATAIGKSHPDQAWRLTEGPVNRLPQRSQHKGQTSQHTALPQQLFQAAGPQDKQSAGLVTGGIQNPQHCKHCPWAHMERHLPTPTSQVPITRGLKRVFAKFWGTHGLSHQYNPGNREKAGSIGTLHLMT